MRKSQSKQQRDGRVECCLSWQSRYIKQRTWNMKSAYLSSRARAGSMNGVFLTHVWKCRVNSTGSSPSYYHMGVNNGPNKENKKGGTYYYFFFTSVEMRGMYSFLLVAISLTYLLANSSTILYRDSLANLPSHT